MEKRDKALLVASLFFALAIISFILIAGLGLLFKSTLLLLIGVPGLVLSGVLGIAVVAVILIYCVVRS